MFYLFLCAILLFQEGTYGQDIKLALTNSSGVYSFKAYGANWVNFTGVPTYRIPQGSNFSVLYQNRLVEPTIIHAHGLTPPTQLDGVPFISAPPLLPGQSMWYNYPVDREINQGTFWVHSHFGFQNVMGLAAPLIIQDTVPPDHPLRSRILSAEDQIMFLRDECPFTDDNENPSCDHMTVYEALATDFNTSYTPTQCPGIVPATDHDVFFRRYVANGKTIDELHKEVTAPGFKRLRVVNGAGMTNFLLKFPPALNATLIATDGQWTRPLNGRVFNNQFWIAVAQRLDFLIEVPQSTDMYYDILALTENVPPTASFQAGLRFIPQTSTNYGPNLSPISSESAGFMAHQTEQHLSAWFPLAPKPVDKQFLVKLTGENGFRGINNASYQLVPMVKTYKPNPNPLKVDLGDRVQITFMNEDSDSHAMHLHGHIFLITQINGQDVRGAMRDVVVVPGGCNSVTIQFDALTVGTWLMHCHYEMHLAAGMVTTVEVS